MKKLVINVFDEQRYRNDAEKEFKTILRQEYGVDDISKIQHIPLVTLQDSHFMNRDVHEIIASRIWEKVFNVIKRENYNRKETFDLLNACLDRDGTIVFIVVKPSGKVEKRKETDGDFTVIDDDA